MANLKLHHLLLAAVPFAVVATVLPASASEGAKPAPVSVTDVVLNADGTLTGRFINSAGHAIDGASVTLSRNQEIVGQTTTDAQGVYQFAVHHGGVYRITAGQSMHDFRVWPAQAAPPGAQSYATVVELTDVVRGQLGGNGLVTGLSIGAGVTGLVLGVVAIDKANDAEDEAAELRAILNSLSP